MSRIAVALGLIAGISAYAGWWLLSTSEERATMAARAWFSTRAPAIERPTIH